MIEAANHKESINVGGNHLLREGASSGLAGESALSRKDFVNNGQIAGSMLPEGDPVSHNWQLRVIRAIKKQAGNFRCYLSGFCVDRINLAIMGKNASWPKPCILIALKGFGPGLIPSC